MVVKKIKKELINIIKEQGFKNLKEAVGSYSSKLIKKFVFFSPCHILYNELILLHKKNLHL